jgi:glutamine amidotransferase
MLAIIDHGSGNIAALVNIFKQYRVPHFVSGNPTQLANADRYLLPGVGAFDTAMAKLLESGIVDTLNEQVLERKKPLLGICVGMQLLAEFSEEGVLPGLGWVSGRVRKIDPSTIARSPRLPHMGWNSINARTNSALFDGVDTQHGFYFLHSYFFDASCDEAVIATVEHGNVMPCAVENGNVYGVQFHPEKSHANGVRLLRNFAEMPAC